MNFSMSGLSNRFKKFHFSARSIPVALLLICFLTYGPLISQLGLYWDDWPSLWFLHFFGPGIFPEAFAADRPVQGWLFMLTSSVVGESLLAWHVFGILARWLTGLAAYWVLTLTWPEHKEQSLWVTLLFLVYPGFFQQYIPITYGHQFLIMSAYLLSIGLMLKAIRTIKYYWLYTSIALIIGVLSLFALEYFFGLELLRPVLLWLVLESLGYSGWQRMKKTLFAWAPYAIASIAFLIWRVTHETPRGDVQIFNKLLINPAKTLGQLLKTIVGDLFEVSILAWESIISNLNLHALKPLVILGYMLTIILVFLILIIYLPRLQTTHSVNENQASIEGRDSRKSWSVSAILVGIYSLFFAGWPFWTTNLPVDLRFPWDRFTLPMMLGVALIIVGIIEILLHPHLLKILLLASMTSLAAGVQFRYAMQYRQEWMAQKAFFWQLAWRAPGLEKGSALITTDLPFPASTDNSLSAALNWIYAPENRTREMDYLFYDVNARLGNRLPDLKPDLLLKEEYRAATYNGNTSQSIAFFYDPPRCLKIFDPRLDKNLPNKPVLLIQAIPLSRPELIIPKPDLSAHPPETIFGGESEHDWCYYFEKADLAVQSGSWDEAAKLADKALPLQPKLNPENAYELIPFISAFAHTNRWQEAFDLSLPVGKLSDKMQTMICNLWLDLAQYSQESQEKLSVMNKIDNQLQCVLE